MAEIALRIGGRAHMVACRDGEETRLAMLAERLDERWPTAMRASGGAGGERAMLLVALMLADALDDAERRPPEDGALGQAAVLSIAERLEALADALEEHAPAS